MRTVLADVLHQIGQVSEALIEFQAAEAIQKEWQPDFPLLYSVYGFWYCDLMLNQGAFQEVQTRIAKTLEASKFYGDLLSIALDQLALGRVHLGLAQQTKDDGLAQAGGLLQGAVSVFQQAGDQTYLPLGLLARAAWARVAQQFDQAHRDLAEARSIAERGEMRLHLCDYHLESARLQLAQGHPDEARTHWETARAMVAEMGYHRRDAEVAALAEALQ